MDLQSFYIRNQGLKLGSMVGFLCAKIEQAQLGETTYNEPQVEVETLESSIAMDELELIELANEQNAISKELHEMQKAGGMSFQPKPILHPNRPLCDAPNMIIMKPCGVCG